jgi:hypothetical protein
LLHPELLEFAPPLYAHLDRSGNSKTIRQILRQAQILHQLGIGIHLAGSDMEMPFVLPIR